MSLLSVTVKKARYVGVQATQFNTYVTLKLQNVKSTTVTVKGPTPCWEQDFLFEINDINLGLLVEVWNKGVIWDRALGYHYLPLTSVAYTEQECGGRWVELEAQLMMRGGAVVGTTGPTGHALMLDCRFEPPFDAEGTGGADLQRKLDLLNGALDAERAEQARRQMQYIAHSGYSEDSDYTSDLNYPVGQHPNCSASQFRSAAHQMQTPQRSLEVSRENSYETEEYHMHGDTDPLYYNSQPRGTRLDAWSQLHAQTSVESAISWRTATDWQSGEEQRRPSLERQTTLYDDGLAYPYDAYSTDIRDHSHEICQQTSYEEYFDSTSNPYASCVGDDSRQWDSGGMYFYQDGYGMTPTEYENTLNKRRSSVVQLPQVPPKQLPASSRYSDFNGMAPYRPRQRRTAASLPATPSSTPRRGRALPVPPGGEAGPARRRLPPAPTPVPYNKEFQKKLPEPRYGYESYGFQPEYQEAANEPYRETNYSTSYDSDGMQPFFDETPHATPPGAAQKTTWSASETITQFTYPVTSEETLVNKPVSLTISSYLPQPPVTSHSDTYREKSLPQPPVTTQQNLYNQTYQYDTQFENQQYRNFGQEEQYEEQSQYFNENQYLDQSQDTQYQYDDQYSGEPKQQELQHQQFLQQQTQQYDQHQAQQFEHQKPDALHHDHQTQETLQYEQQQQYAQHQQQFQQQQQQFQQHQQSYQLQQQQQQPLQNQQKPTAQQPIQTSLLTGAATFGSFMAGGAKKFGSFLGAAAAAVSAPVSQTPMTVPASTAPTNHLPLSVAPTTPFTSATTVPISASVPEVSPSVPVSAVTTSVPVSLPRTPSLRRQESIQRPPVRRTRTLPDAPDDLLASSFDESAYEGEYDKTEYEQSIDRERTSLDRYRDDDFVNDTIHEDVIEERRMSEEPAPTLQKAASPTRNGSIRKPSLDSYHSQAPSVVDRRTSQSSYHGEDKLAVPIKNEDSIIDKSKVNFQEDRKKYHEVPEETDRFRDREPYDEQSTEYSDDREGFNDQDEAYREEDEKFEDQEAEEQYPEEDAVFQEGQVTAVEPLEFHPEQPKLTPKQRWHRAYNKIVMQLTVSLYTNNTK